MAFDKMFSQDHCIKDDFYLVLDNSDITVEKTLYSHKVNVKVKVRFSFKNSQKLQEQRNTELDRVALVS